LIERAPVYKKDTARLANDILFLCLRCSCVVSSSGSTASSTENNNDIGAGIQILQEILRTYDNKNPKIVLFALQATGTALAQLHLSGE
jgi:hypothetical protein